MRNLLQKNERRHLEMIEILHAKNTWITLKELSQNLEYSTRILKADIAYLKENFKEFSIETSYKGIRIMFKEHTGIQAIYQKKLKESLAFQLLEYIFLNEGKNSEELSEVFFVSLSTLHRLTKKIDHALETYHGINLISNPYKVIGAENRIRYFYSQYFSERNLCLEWPFSTIDEPVFEQFLLFFIEYTKIPVDFATFRKLKIVTAVNLIRVQRNHYVENNETNFSEIIPDLSIYKEFFRPIEEKLNIAIDNKMVHQLFAGFVQKGFSLNYERLNEKTQNDEKIKEEVDFLSKFLSKLSQKNSISLNNEKDIILALHNASNSIGHKSQSGYILFDKKQHFSNAIKQTYPEFFAQMYDGLKNYMRKLNKSVTEISIHSLIYILFTHWENLIAELQRKLDSIKILIISSYDINHAKMIKDLIAFEFPEQLSIDLYDGIELSLATLKNLPYDIVVANLPLPNLKSPYCICIESIPTNDDIEKIKNKIHQSTLIKSSKFHTM